MVKQLDVSTDVTQRLDIRGGRSKARGNVPHPIPYQGSKRNLCSAILAYFPPQTGRLIEPFAGSAAVSLAAAYHKKAEYYILNDMNSPLMCLWRAIIEEPEAIAASYQRLWEAQRGREREYYDIIREEFNRTQRPDCLLYLLARCVKASVRYNPAGEFNQSPDNRRKGAHPRVMAERIDGASMLLRGKTEIVCGDYRSILEAVVPDSDLVYMDPPYQGVCGKRDARYLGQIAYEGFVDALDDLNRKGISYIVSYDGRSDTKTYGDLLPPWLSLARIEIEVGRSSQATLLGRDSRTYESLYLSPALWQRTDKLPDGSGMNPCRQMSLLDYHDRT